MVMTNKLLLP